MQFEKDIPTAPLISIMHREHAKFLNKKVKDDNLSYGLYPLLIKIYKCEGIIQEDLAKIFQLNESTITRNLKKLEDKEFIERIPDKRKKVIKITEKGKITAKKVMDYDEQWDLSLKKHITTEEYDNFIKTLKKICVELK
jgi:DNA-binding MarR family transcriptional regulator